MNLTTFQGTLRTFYQRPSPQLAEELVLWWVTTSHAMQRDFQENPCNIVLYALIRLAEIYPELLREYERRFDEANPWGQRFLARVLAHCGDDLSVNWATNRGDINRFEDLRILSKATRRGRIAMLPIRTATQLDYWWMEFLLTGDRAAIAEVASCLRQRSVIREKLDRWLARRAPFTWLGGRSRRRAVDRLEQRFGIACEQREVKNLEDLDCVCLQEEAFGDIRYGAITEAAKYLPFRLSYQAQMEIGTKMMAKWSLFSNALQHSTVRDFCFEASEGVENGPRAELQFGLTMLDIAANIHAAEGNGSESLRLAKRFIDLDSHSRRLRRMTEKLEADQELNDVLNAARPASKDASSSQPNMRDVLEDCVEQTGRTASYTTECRVTIESEQGRQQAMWRLAFEHPDRFEVYQRVGNDEDAWFTIDGRTLHRLHLLAQSPQPDTGDEPAVNRRLLVGNILEHLPSMQVERYGLSDAGRGYVVLAGKLPTVPRFAIELGASGINQCDIDVWIDKDFKKMLRLVRYSLRAGPVSIVQAFSGYNQTQVSLEEFG
jgi:hypothetical protein